MRAPGDVARSPAPAPVRRVWAAGILAVLGPVSVGGVFVLLVGEWRVTGLGTIVVVAILAGFGYAAANLAGHDHLLFGVLAGEVAALGSLPDPFGVAFTLGSGVLGGWIASWHGTRHLATPTSQRVLGTVALVGVVAFAGLSFVPAGEDTDDPEDPAAIDPTPIADAYPRGTEEFRFCPPATRANTTDDVAFEIGYVPPTVTEGEPIAVAGLARFDDPDAFFTGGGASEVMSAGYVVIEPRSGDGPTWAEALDDVPRMGPRPERRFSGDFDGRTCEDGRLGEHFTAGAEPGHYELRLLYFSGTDVWASEPLEFEVVPVETATSTTALAAGSPPSGPATPPDEAAADSEGEVEGTVRRPPSEPTEVTVTCQANELVVKPNASAATDCTVRVEGEQGLSGSELWCGGDLPPGGEASCRFTPSTVDVAPGEEAHTRLEVSLGDDGYADGGFGMDVWVEDTASGAYLGGGPPEPVIHPHSIRVVIPEFSLRCTRTGGGEPPYERTGTCTVASFGGFEGTVTLTCNPPSGVSCSISPTEVAVPSGGSATADVRLEGSESVPPGSHEVTIRGTGAGLVRTSWISYDV